MASSADVREWARDNGYEVGDKGNLPKNIRDAYDAAHPGTNGAGPDYPDDDFESAFADMPDDDADDLGDTGETAPKSPKSRSRSRGSGSRFGFGRGGGTRQESKGKKKPPRISTENLLGSMWRGLAKLATPLPPLQRTLRVQAPVAGMLLEDAVKGTVVDTFLQPLARLADGGKTVTALLGPPVLVSALSVHMMQAQAAERPPNPFFMSAGTEALRGSLMTWIEVAGPKFAIALAREKRFEEEYGQTVDDFIAMLFAAPVDPTDSAAVQAEEDAIRRAQGVL